MSKLIFVLVLSVVLLVSQVSAFTFLNVYVSPDGGAEFLGETDEVLALPSGVTVSDGIISGTTQEVTGKSGSLWTLIFDLPGAEVNVVLPDGAVVKNAWGGEVSIVKGRISVFFVGGVSLDYEVGPSPVNEGSSWNIGLLLILGIVFIVFLVFLIVFLANFSKREKSVNKGSGVVVDKSKLISRLLSVREKKILFELKRSGKVKQSHLRKLCEVPKASFSRHLQELEKKGLIARSGEGKNKFVEIVE